MKLHHLLVIILLTALSGCTKVPEEQIIGAWIDDDGVRFEFFEDGDLTFQEHPGTGGFRQSGEWTRLSDGRFKITMSAMGFTTTMTFHATFPDNDTMEMILEDEEEVTLRRERRGAQQPS